MLIANERDSDSQQNLRFCSIKPYINRYIHYHHALGAALCLPR
jgi:hypothetical protein